MPGRRDTQALYPAVFLPENRYFYVKDLELPLHAANLLSYYNHVLYHQVQPGQGQPLVTRQIVVGLYLSSKPLYISYNLGLFIHDQPPYRLLARIKKPGRRAESCGII